MAMHYQCYLGNHDMEILGLIGEGKVFILYECRRCHVRKAEKV